MKPRLDMNKIAKALGAERRGTLQVTGGYFGAAQVAAEIQERFRVPKGRGRSTVPHCTKRRLVGLSTSTLRRLQEIGRSHQQGEAYPLECNANCGNLDREDHCRC